METKKDPTSKMTVKPSEPEHVGTIWTHPYFMYVYGTVILALFLGFMGWLAYVNDWIPTR
jgi:hypothetical protein